MSSKYILEMNHIEKDFFGNKVLKDVSIKVKPGEIVALIGENGAGKSTIMNILFGMPAIQQTGGFKGSVLIDGEEVHIKSPIEAMKYGIGMVHQEFMLIDGYDVAENIKLNRENVKKTPASLVFGKRLDLVDRTLMHKESRATLDSLGIELSDRTRVGSLPVGYKQFVEIARELDKKNTKLIVLDEPTAVLTETEAEQFLACVRSVAERGIAFIFISHKLDEVMEISDKIVVLRDGELVDTIGKGEVDVVGLAKLMVGRNVDFSAIAGRPPEEMGKNGPIMQIKGLGVKMPGENVKGVDIDIHKGEILGFCGLAGQGKLAIANGIAGLYPSTGEVIYKGKKLPFGRPLEILKSGIGFVSEDRSGIGLLMDESIRMNICLLAMQIKNRFFKSYGFFRQLDRRSMKRTADDMVRELGIKCVSSEQHPSDLSGGNQQKVCIAKAVVFEPDMLFVSEPTRGIDIGAKKVILDYLLTLNRDKGITIVITSSELVELRSLCDRIAVVYDGRVKSVLKPTDSDETFGLLMSGLDAVEVQ